MLRMTAHSMRRSRLAGSVLAAILLLAGSSCAHRAALPLPRMSGQTGTLKVAHVVKPRCPRMTAAQIWAVLAAARGSVKENFGVNVEFLEPEEQSLETVLERVTSKDRRDWSNITYDFKSGEGNRTRLARGYA